MRFFYIKVMLSDYAFSDFDEQTVTETIYNEKNNLNEVFPNPDSCKSSFYMANIANIIRVPKILCSETHKMLQLKG